MKAHELKTSIIQSAIKGHLVPQSKDDGTANEILKSALKKKKELIEEKILKNKEQSLPIVPAEMIFEKPQNWEWVRVNSLFAINPKNTIKDETDVGFVPMRMIEDGFQNKHGYEVKSWKNIKKGYTHFQESDIAIAKITPCFENRKSVILKDLPNNHGAGTTEIFVLRPYTDKINLKYFLYIFKNQEFISSGVKSFTGTAGHQRVSKSFLDNYIIALPPKKEQDRIVHKLEELLNKIDQYDKLEQKLSILNTDFPSNMEKSILQYALQGKLVEQRIEEDSAEILFEQIQTEKKNLIKDKIIKSQNKSSEITYEEIPFKIPENWKWVRLNDLTYLKSGGKYTESTEGAFYVKVADMNLPGNEYEITTSSRKSLINYNAMIPKYSIIFPKRGGAIATNKKKLILQSEILIDSNTMSMTAIDKDCLMYIYYWFLSIDLGRLSTGTSVPQINNKDLQPLLVPLPPIKEQKRIINKIEELFNLNKNLNKLLK